MTTDESLEERLTTALGNEPVRTSTIDANGAESWESEDDYQARYDAWADAYEVQSLEDADWAARKHRQLTAKIGEVDKIMRDQIAQIEQWAAHERARYDARLAYFASRLEHYHRQQRASDPKHAITIDLPCGARLVSSKGKIRTEITDEKAAIAWLEENHSLAVKYPDPEILKVEVKRVFAGKAVAEKEPGTYPAVSKDGEIVPGIAFTRGETAYTVS